MVLTCIYDTFESVANKFVAKLWILASVFVFFFSLTIFPPLYPLFFGWVGVVFTTRPCLWVCQINSSTTSRRDWKGCRWSSTANPTSCTYWAKQEMEENRASESLIFAIIQFYKTLSCYVDFWLFWLGCRKKWRNFESDEGTQCWTRERCWTCPPKRRTSSKGLPFGFVDHHTCTQWQFDFLISYKLL